MVKNERSPSDVLRMRIASERTAAKNRWNAKEEKKEKEKERRERIESDSGGEEREEGGGRGGGRRGLRSLCTLTTVGTGRGDRSNANRSFENRSAATGGSRSWAMAAHER